MGDLEALRRFYARLITTSAGVEDPRIVEAFASIERERFLGQFSDIFDQVMGYAAGRPINVVNPKVFDVLKDRGAS